LKCAAKGARMGGEEAAMKTVMLVVLVLGGMAARAEAQCPQQQRVLAAMQQRHPDWPPEKFASYQRELDECLAKNAAQPAPWKRPPSPEGKARADRVTANKTDPKAQRVAWSGVACEAKRTRAEFTTPAASVKPAQVAWEMKRLEDVDARVAAAFASLKVEPLPYEDATVTRVAACVYATCTDDAAMEYVEVLPLTVLRKPWTLPPGRRR